MILEGENLYAIRKQGFSTFVKKVPSTLFENRVPQWFFGDGKGS